MILKRKKNWNSVELKKSLSGYIITLDGNTLRTPSKKECIIENQSIANEVHKEWSKLQYEVDYDHMPYTKTCFISIDRSENESLTLKNKLVGYGKSDLLCYRAEKESDLTEIQSKSWDPLLQWMHSQFHVNFKVSYGIMPVEQTSDLESTLSKLIAPIDSLALTAVNDIVTFSGSLVIGLTLFKGRLKPANAWKIIRIDEDWQRERWGTLDEQVVEDNINKTMFMHACRILKIVQK